MYQNQVLHSENTQLQYRNDHADGYIIIINDLSVFIFAYHTALMVTLSPGVKSWGTNSQWQLLLSSTISSPGRLASTKHNTWTEQLQNEWMKPLNLHPRLTPSAERGNDGKSKPSVSYFVSSSKNLCTLFPLVSVDHLA